ncbi:hypothetical protein KZZ20_10425 [Methylacidiphilum fumariolicum]|nr:hypothetical protein [Candidatus Methylacidiphilum fumarolicum]MBW6415917.1 hypothetical protein [Candidatus Methylacidiphilum fumarolicum]
MEKSIVGIDPNNPGHAWACCGLAELCGRIEPESLFRFELDEKDSRFVTNGPLDEALRRLLSDETRVQRVAKKNEKRKKEESGENEDESKDDPILLHIPGLEPLRLDWWLKWSEKGELKPFAPMKLWAGQRDGLEIFNGILRECRSQRNENWLKWKGDNPALGVDPSIAWTTRSTGHSIVPHGNKPGIELLASIGLLWSKLSTSYQDWRGRYMLWTRPLPLPSARLAMVRLLEVEGKRYWHEIEWRGSNKNWKYAREE